MSDTEATSATDPRWTDRYVAACSDVLDSANACLEVANVAMAARDKATERPQHEISIRNFIKMAEQQEQQLVPLYQTFSDACAKARDIAAEVLATQDRANAEMALMLAVEEQVLDNVAMVKEILRATYGPSPAEFLQGVNATNALMQAPPSDDGNIYTPLPSSERTCPWCAETIKAAAIVCRYCGRDVDAPSAG